MDNKEENCNNSPEGVNNIETISTKMPPEPAKNSSYEEASRSNLIILSPLNKTAISMDFFSWLPNIRQDIRKNLKESTPSSNIQRLLDDFTRRVRDEFIYYIHFLHQCVFLTKQIVQISFLLKNLCWDFDNSSEFLCKMCELLALYTEIELRCSRGSKSLTYTAERITKLYDSLLKNADSTYILRIFLQVTRPFDQNEAVKIVFGNYLKTKRYHKMELPDRLYIMNLIALKKWKSLGADSETLQEIYRLASYLRPKPTFRTSVYSSVIRLGNTRDEGISSYILTEKINTPAVIDLILNEGVITNPEIEIIDLSVDEVVPEKSRCQINVDGIELSASNTEQETRIKTETPEIVDIIDLTDEDSIDPDLSWYDTLKEKANEMRPSSTISTERVHNILAIIELDDDSSDEIIENNETIVYECSDDENPVAPQEGENLLQNKITADENQEVTDIENVMTESVEAVSNSLFSDSPNTVNYNLEANPQQCKDQDNLLLDQSNPPEESCKEKILISQEEKNSSSCEKSCKIGNAQIEEYREYENVIEMDENQTLKESGVELSASNKDELSRKENNPIERDTLDVSSKYDKLTINAEEEKGEDGREGHEMNVESAENNAEDFMADVTSHEEIVPLLFSDDHYESVNERFLNDNQITYYKDNYDQTENSDCLNVNNMLCDSLSNRKNDFNGENDQGTKLNNVPLSDHVEENDDDDDEDDYMIKHTVKNRSQPLRTYEKKNNSKTSASSAIKLKSFSPYSSDLKSEFKGSSSSSNALDYNINQHNISNSSDVTLPSIDKIQYCYDGTLAENVVFRASTNKRISLPLPSDSDENQFSLNSSTQNVIFSMNESRVLPPEQINKSIANNQSVNEETSEYEAANEFDVGDHPIESENLESAPSEDFSKADSNEICQFMRNNSNKTKKTNQLDSGSRLRSFQKDETNTQARNVEIENLSKEKKQIRGILHTEGKLSNIKSSAKPKYVTFATHAQERPSSVINVYSPSTDPIILDRKSYERISISNSHQPWPCSATNVKNFNHQLITSSSSNQQKLPSNNQHNSRVPDSSYFNTNETITKNCDSGGVKQLARTEIAYQSNNEASTSSSFVSNMKEKPVNNWAVQRQRKRTENSNNTTRSSSTNSKISDFDRYLQERRILIRDSEVAKTVNNTKTSERTPRLRKRQLSRRKSISSTRSKPRLSEEDLLQSFNDDKLIKIPTVQLIRIDDPNHPSFNTYYQIDTVTQHNTTSDGTTSPLEFVVQVFKKTSDKHCEKEIQPPFVRLKRLKNVSKYLKIQNDTSENIYISDDDCSISNIIDLNVSSSVSSPIPEVLDQNIILPATSQEPLTIIEESTNTISTSTSLSSINTKEKRSSMKSPSTSLVNFEIELSDDPTTSTTTRELERRHIEEECSNLKDKSINENVVSSTQDARSNVFTESLNSNVTVDQSKLVQNNEVDTSNPSIIHRSGRRRTYENSELSSNSYRRERRLTFSNNITYFYPNNDEAINAPTTTTIEKISRKRNPRKVIKKDLTLDDYDDYNFKSKKQYKRKRKEPDSETSIDSHFNDLSNNASTSVNIDDMSSLSSFNSSIKHNSQNAKTYSNRSFIHKIFVPPDIEQIIEETVPSKETEETEIEVTPSSSSS